LLLVDASPSMALGGGRKLAAAAAGAAALARLALVTGHPVYAARYAERLLDVGGPWRGPDGFAAAQAFLAGAPPSAGAGTDLGRALEALLSGRQRPCCLVALTDGFQETALTAAAGAALARGARRVVIVRILDPTDAAPRLRGRTLLRDPEGSGTREIFADHALEASARARIAEHFDRLGEGLRRLHVPLHELRAPAPFEEAFLDLLRGAPAPAGRVA
ncbi:MAG TPA: hypothetical protein VN317_01115, partial [Candidatus Methanoperedens sp.]|nr:hypothetical protein [Candidatus Methanoperedens sp.]